VPVVDVLLAFLVGLARLRRINDCSTLAKQIYCTANLVSDSPGLRYETNSDFQLVLYSQRELEVLNLKGTGVLECCAESIEECRTPFYVAAGFIFRRALRRCSVAVSLKLLMSVATLRRRSDYSRIKTRMFPSFRSGISN
jgi:hypothetical protein